MNKQTTYKLLLVTFGILSALIVAELLLRAADMLFSFGDRYRLEMQADIYASDPVLNHTLSPGLDLIVPAHVNIDIPAYRLTTNRLGFRFDLERFREKRSDAFRIAFLGDSQIEGYQLESTLPYLVERRLQGNFGVNVEVMNFGVMSYSPIIHYVNLKRNVLAFKPDLVVLCVDMTDVFDDNHRYREITTWDAAGNPVAVKAAVEFTAQAKDGKARSTMEVGKEMALRNPFASANAFKVALMEVSLLYRAIYCTLHQPGEVTDLYDGIYVESDRSEHERVNRVNLIDIHGWCRDYEKHDASGEIDFSLGMLRRINALLRAEGIPLALITVPARAQMDPPLPEVRYSQKPIERLRRFCRQERIPFFTPLEQLQRELLRGRNLYYSDYMHLNVEGQPIWADLLAAGLAPFIDRGVVRRSPAKGR